MNQNSSVPPVGANLRQWLTANNLTVTQAANLAQVSRRVMHFYCAESSRTKAFHMPEYRWRLMLLELQRLKQPIDKPV